MDDQSRECLLPFDQLYLGSGNSENAVVSHRLVIPEGVGHTEAVEIARREGADIEQTAPPTTGSTGTARKQPWQASVARLRAGTMLRL